MLVSLAVDVIHPWQQGVQVCALQNFVSSLNVRTTVTLEGVLK